jgi:hypothetical protein
MKNLALAFVSASTILFSTAAHANESVIIESKSIGTALSKEDVQKGIENGTFCTDSNGLANSRGAVIKQNGRLYRCVKAYGENFIESKKLVWVELSIKNGQAVIAD